MDLSTCDETLVAARTGDAGALTSLWRRHAPAVSAFVRARGVEDVDAVTSDVFLGAFARLDRFDGGEQEFRALLFTIARRRAADDVRRRARRVRVVPWSSAEDAAVASAEDDVVGRDHGGSLLRRLEVLTPDQREVLLLRLVADLPIAAVAEVLGKSPGTVKSLQHRALETLRRHVTIAPDEEVPS